MRKQSKQSIAAIFLIFANCNVFAAESITGRDVQNDDIDLFEILNVLVNLLTSGYNMVYFIAALLGAIFFIRGVWIMYKASNKANEDDDRHTMGKGIKILVISGVVLSFGVFQIASQNTFNTSDASDQEVIEVSY